MRHIERYLFRTFLGVLILLLASHVSFAFEGDSLHFHSEKERSAFEAVYQGRADLNTKVSLLLCLDPEFDTEQTDRVVSRVQGTLAYLKTNYRPGKYKRFSKDMFFFVHNSYLGKYQPLATFADIYDKGLYNCATATALFALLSDEMQVPNVIREQPNHVFLLIDPEGEKILLESTDPGKGIYAMKPEQYVEILMKMKMVSKEEAAGKTALDIYNDYVGEFERNISFVNLVGDLYHNLALREAEAKRMETALDLIDKAYYLNQSKLTTGIRNALILDAFMASDIRSGEFFEYLERLIDVEEIKNDAVSHALGNFGESGERILINEGNPELYAKIYHSLKNLMDTTEFQQQAKDLDIYHFDIQMRYNWALQNWKNCIAYCDSGLQIFPNDVRIRSDLAAAIGNHVLKASLKNEELERYIDLHRNKYPFLEDNVVFKELIVVSKGMKAYEAFQKDQPTKGFEVLEEFSALLSGQGMTDRTQQMVGMVYGQISAYYIRNRQIPKGKEWIMKGLQVVPENQELQSRLRSVEDYERNYR